MTLSEFLLLQVVFEIIAQILTFAAAMKFGQPPKIFYLELAIFNNPSQSSHNHAVYKIVRTRAQETLRTALRRRTSSVCFVSQLPSS